MRLKYNKYALFFWNGLKGDAIYIMWKPAAFLPKKLTILESTLRQPVSFDDSGKGDQLTITNIAELLTNIISACDGLVKCFDMI